MVEASATKSMLICLLDKEDPPDHSFVSGMLAEAVPANGVATVRLVVGRADDDSGRPRRYGRSVCIPGLPPLPRSGWRRIETSIRAYGLTRQLIRRAHRRGKRVTLFVRNDPLLLMVAGLLRARAGRLVFQSSHPLEESHSRALMRSVHRLLYRLGGRAVDAVLAVSPLGLARIRRLLPKAKKGAHIPLLADEAFLPTTDHAAAHPASQPVRFVYVGAHRGLRRLDIVLRAAVRSLEAGVAADFSFIGGSEGEIGELRAVSDVAKWERAGRIHFEPAVARHALAHRLISYDVGLCLLPATRRNREASPTKLAEYMGVGLAVLASEGVELQERFVEQSQAGVLVRFEVEPMAEAIQAIASDPASLARMKENACAFARRELCYVNHLDEFCSLIEHS